MPILVPWERPSDEDDADELPGAVAEEVADVVAVEEESLPESVRLK